MYFPKFLKFYKNISDEVGMETSSTFALKALQKDKPFVILTVTLIAVSVVFGILLRMVEM